MCTLFCCILRVFIVGKGLVKNSARRGWSIKTFSEIGTHGLQQTHTNKSRLCWIMHWIHLEKQTDLVGNINITKVQRLQWKGIRRGPSYYTPGSIPFCSAGVTPWIPVADYTKVVARKSLNRINEMNDVSVCHWWNHIHSTFSTFLDSLSYQWVGCHAPYLGCFYSCVGLRAFWLAWFLSLDLAIMFRLVLIPYNQHLYKSVVPSSTWVVWTFVCARVHRNRSQSKHQGDVWAHC